MKRAILLILLICVTNSYANKSKRSDGDLKFKIDARVEGMMVGDTLLFQSYKLPSWEYTILDTMIVTQANRFIYKGEHNNIEMLSVRYFPGAETRKANEGRDFSSTRMGAAVLVEDGTTLWQSDIFDFNYPLLSSKLYTDPAVRAFTQLEDSLGKVNSSYLRKRKEAAIRQDTTEITKYTTLFNNARSTPDYGRLKVLKKTMQASNTKYAVCDLLRDSKLIETEVLRTRYDQLSQDIKSCALGVILADIIETRSRTDVGKPAVDIIFTSMDGVCRKISDYKGRYLMMYFGGMCPGSFMIQSSVDDLDKKFKDKGLSLVLFTNDLEKIGQLNTQIPKGAMMQGGVDLKLVLESLMSQRMTTVDTSKELNKSIEESYLPAGMPFFILISPDGTILARGFREAYNAAVKILDENLVD